MVTLTIATRNMHKVGEIRAILGEAYHYVTLKELPDAPEVDEDAATFEGNAAKKANELAKWLQAVAHRRLDISVGEVFVLADDSGLEVDALNGGPGVHSARFAALDTGQSGNSTSAENNAKLLRLLTSVPPERRTARFRCVMALARVNDVDLERAPGSTCSTTGGRRAMIFDGACEGRIISELRGAGGFGYDPLFVPDGHESTFGELGEEVKNRLSHRAHALAKLKQWLDSQV